MYKNDEFVSTNYCDWEEYPNIPHAPFIFDDYVGELLVNRDTYSKKDAIKLTKLINAFYHDGFNMSLANKLRYLNLSSRKICSYEDFVALFEEFIAMQQTKPTVFKFEGYVDDEVVITKEKGHSNEAILKAKADHLDLEHGFTYDVTRIVVRMTDEFDNDLLFSNDVVEVSTDNLEIIGPNKLAMVAGSQAFYVKTIKPGKAKISIKSTRNQEVKIILNVLSGKLEY